MPYQLIVRRRTQYWSKGTVAIERTLDEIFDASSDEDAKKKANEILEKNHHDLDPFDNKPRFIKFEVIDL